MEKHEVEPDFIVECNVCGRHLHNWTGSTPCCGSIAYLVDKDGKKTDEMNLFVSVNGGPIKPATISFPNRNDQP
jgi:predicted ATP-dependent serine protease